MEKKKCDILSLELYSTGRDIDIVEPVLCFLEKKHSLNVIRKDIYNYAYWIIKFNPKLLIVSNSIGSSYKCRAVKLASQLGIKVVTLVSEGGVSSYYLNRNFNENDFWGLNREKKMYEDISLMWNKNDYLVATEFVSQNKLKITGATLFDKYKIFPRVDKKSFLLKYNKSYYDKIILITAWGFSALNPNKRYAKRNKETIELRLGGEKYVKLHRKSKDIVRDIYENIIDSYQDILFIIKEHPSEKDYDSYTDTEYYLLDKKKNVLFIKGYDESMYTLLNISDILLTYDSTSTLEAWLSGVVSINVNPLGEDFPRLPFYQGAINAKSFEQVKNYVSEFYSNNRQICDFNLKEDTRKEIIKNFIYSDDGKNYIRASNEVLKLLNNKENKKIHLSFWEIKEIFKGYLKNILKSHYAKYVDNIYSDVEREKWRKIYYKSIK